jgi:aminoglycoside phosphotransferase (APT) family kinase protein
MPELGPLIASGRDADIFAYGPDLVVRRSRRGHSMEREARVMRHVAAHRYPAPRVEEVRAGGAELVMERVDGPTMLDVLASRPSAIPSQAATLASLHRQLHDIPAPDWLERFVDTDGCIVHLDLHPLNVIVSSRGPVLIDWTNARRGAGPTDVAMTWLILAAAELPDRRLAAVRDLFVHEFLGHFDLRPVRSLLPAVAAWKCDDRNMRPTEADAIRRLVAAESSGA